MKTKYIYDLEIGDHVDKNEISGDEFFISLKGEHDNLVLFVEQHENSGFKFTMGAYFGLAQNLALPLEERADPSLSLIHI